MRPTTTIALSEADAAKQRQQLRPFTDSAEPRTSELGDAGPAQEHRVNVTKPIPVPGPASPGLFKPYESEPLASRRRVGATPYDFHEPGREESEPLPVLRTDTEPTQRCAAVPPQPPPAFRNGAHNLVCISNYHFNFS